MKVDDKMRFPHPVLWVQTSDYLQGEIGVSFQIAETISTGEIKAVCSVTVTELEVGALLESGKAAVGIFVSCIETYFNQLFPLGRQGGPVHVPSGLLRGQVTFRPVIWANDSIESFHSPNVHPEFGDAPLDFDETSIIALGEATVISVGSDKLAPMGSIFDLSRDDDVAANQVAVQLENEKVQILVCESTLEKIHLLRNTPAGRALLLNSVYLPVVMDILHALRSDDQVYEGKRWHTVFTAKLDHLGIKVASADLLDAAQRLLKSPFGRLDTYIEGKSS